MPLAGCPPGTNTTDTTTGGTDTSDTSETTGNLDIPYICDRYVNCYAVATPDNAPEVIGKYGAAGSCWELDTDGQTTCIDECETGLLQYAMYFPELPECELPETDVTFEIGEAVFTDVLLDEANYELRQDGDTLTILEGGQGLQMIAVGLRGRNFETADNVFDWDDPRMPTVNYWMDIEGFNIGVGDHFSRLYNYPVHFEDLGGGELEHMYIAMIVPDELEGQIAQLDGLPGHLWIELWTFENPPVTRELDFFVRIDPGSG